jgi:hypothetical protein
MNKIKVKIVNVDELSQSLLVSFSDTESEPSDANALAFQPHFFGNLDKDALYKAIGQSGVSIIENQKLLTQARLDSNINNYAADIGKVMEIDITPQNVVAAGPDTALLATIRSVLLEEGLIK